MAQRPQVTYVDGVGPLNGAAARPRQLLQALGIRWIDAGAAVVVAALVELNVAVGGGPGAVPLNGVSYLLGAVLAVPILFRHRWPLGSLLGCAALVLLYYIVDRRNISPAPLLCLPLYDAAVAGYLAAAIAIPAFFMSVGLVVVGLSSHQGLVTLATDFLPSIAVLALAIMLGEVIRSRRALAAETADRLRLASEEREAETGRRVAEERLRIARELHDTVAHSMATITVQAGSALHVLGRPGPQTRTAARTATCAARSSPSGRPAKGRSPRCGARWASSATRPGTSQPGCARPGWTGCPRCARRLPPQAPRSA